MAALTGVVALAGAASTAPASAAVTTAVATTTPTEDFYSVPASLPPAPGGLVRSQDLPFALDLPVVLPARATRIMHTSTDAAGRRVAVTGSYLEPRRSWAGPGPRPLVTLAPGTQGQGDQCAPSRTLQFPIAVSRWSTALNYELVSVAALLNQGYAVVMTDYHGMGTSDAVHTYASRLEQGRAVLDAARVAPQVPGASVTADSPVAAWGYSQGGGAAAAAAEMHHEYAPQVRLGSAVVGAPPADLEKVLPGIEGSLIAGAGGYAVNSLRATNPEIGPALDASLNDVGHLALRRMSQQCIGDSITSYAFTRSDRWTKDGSTIGQVVARNPEVRAAVQAQRLGRVRPDVPVLVTSDRADGTVPHAQVKQLVTDWTALGADVTWKPLGVAPLPGDTDRWALHHLAGMPATLSVGLPWLKARLAG